MYNQGLIRKGAKIGLFHGLKYSLVFFCCSLALLFLFSGMLGYAIMYLLFSNKILISIIVLYASFLIFLYFASAILTVGIFEKKQWFIRRLKFSFQVNVPMWLAYFISRIAVSELSFSMELIFCLTMFALSSSLTPFVIAPYIERKIMFKIEESN